MAAGDLEVLEGVVTAAGELVEMAAGEEFDLELAVSSSSCGRGARAAELTSRC